MGRKPNPVISKHFTRGAKIGDASNRYQFTCKQCGERFPKGRIETLYNHITMKCTALSSGEKSILVLQIHELDLAANAASAAKNMAKSEKSTKGGLQFSTSPQQPFDGLNALAEASRQVVATQSSRSAPATTNDDIGGTPMVLDPALEKETFPYKSFNGMKDYILAGENGFASADGSGVAALSSAEDMPRYSSDNATTIASHIHIPISLTTSHSQIATLTSIAASASATLAQSMITKSSTAIQESGRLFDGLLSAPTMIIGPTPNRLPTGIAVNEACDDGRDATALEQHITATFPRPIAMRPDTRANDLQSESPPEALAEKPRIRAAFSEDRKREVKKMRKIGSCIRCKMLKKPCSASTPCVTCGAIDSPRTWKGFPCLRAKLNDLYQGYTLGLHQTLSVRDIKAAKSRMRFAPYPGKLVIRYFEDADPIMLDALEGGMDEYSDDPSLSVISSGHGFAKTVILDSETNDLPTIFEEYIQKETAALFLDHQASPVINSVAKLLYQYSKESEDMLLQDVVELWMLTTMLSDPTRRWKISALQNPPEGPSDLRYGRAVGGLPIHLWKEQQSYNLIYSQLQSGLERLASKLSTHVMNKFEKRLLRPVSLKQFETFLMAILLINCVERRSWVFHSWTKESRAPQWPLDQPPAVPILEAEQVTTVIAFMIKIRNLTSKITENAGGDVLKAVHTSDERYAKWFGEVGVTINFLKRRQDAVFDPDDCCSLDLKYSATLLLPSQNPDSA